ncbi:MAG: SUMF1/EgtB/PvdO family nonheme iron enzyme, partial [Acidimicrobiales bacterium]
MSERTSIEESVDKDRIAAALGAGRTRSLRLLEPLDERDLKVQHSPLMSPLIWDLAHIGNYEDQWLLRAIAADGVGPELDDMYDAFRHPRPNRPQLPLLGPEAAAAYLTEVRDRALDHLNRVEFDGETPVLRRGFVYSMVIQHEHQHDETMLATLQLMDAPGYRPDALLAPRAAATPASTASTEHIVGAEVAIPAGTYRVGTDVDPWAYDNERPAHDVEADAFRIDAAPVTNGQFAAFIEDGGYDRRALWDDEGWEWRLKSELAHPEFWERNGGEWIRNRFGRTEVVPDNEPVQHVCFFEADAYARWAGKRLPTESEWEIAASIDPATGAKGRFPWGDEAPTAAHANLGGTHYGPAEVGAYPSGVSGFGCHQMIGDVWEW